MIFNPPLFRPAIMRAALFSTPLRGPDQVIKEYDLTTALPSGATITRASSGTRFNSSGVLVTETSNAARFDYDPVSLSARGLLIEAAATNLAFQSDTLATSPWASASSTVTANAVAAPDSNTAAESIALQSTAGATQFALIYQLVSSLTAGQTYTLSVWLKGAVGGEQVWLMETPNGTAYSRTAVTLTTGWVRYSHTFTASGTSTYIQIGVDKRDTSQTGKAAATIHAWRVQLEAGSNITTGIQTTSAAASRSADTLTLPLTDGVWEILATYEEGTNTTRVSAYGSGAQIPAVTSKRRLRSIKATLIRRYPAGLDTDAMAWFGAQSITDSALQAKYLSFTSLCKTLTPTLWSRLMLIPCRDGEGYLSNYGGGISAHPSQLRGNFREVGTVSKSSAGASIAYASNWANRIETPTGYVHGTHRSEPTFMGLIYKNTIPGGVKFQNAAELIRWNVGTTSSFIANYSGGDSQTSAWQTGIAINGAQGGQFIAANAFANNSVDVPQFVGFDFQNARLSVAQLSNENYQLATHASASPSTSAIGTGLYFYPGIKSTGGTSGQLQYLVFIAGGIIDIAAEAKKFWDILRGTLLSDVIAPVHFHQGGQSLSSGYLQRALQMQLNTDRTVTTTAHSYGGTPIANWVGSNPASPARGSQYTGGFYAGNGTGGAEAGWPTGNSTVPKWIVWLQGESDTEARSTATVYQQQLTNLFSFLTADLGSDFKMAVNILDYSIGYRTTAVQGDFTLSGLTGGGTSANGAWSIAAITATTSGGLVTNATAAYSWTKSGGGTITKNGSGLWEIAISGTVYATADQITAHPELVTSWTLSNGATGTPAFSESRTGNIERVRAAQTAFAAANPTRVVTFDSRGVTRPVDTGASSDAVHPDNAGQDQLAIRAKAAMLSLS